MKSKRDINEELFKLARDNIRMKDEFSRHEAKKLISYFDKVAEDTKLKIEGIYHRFAKNNGMTVVEAKKYLSESEYNAFRMSLADYMEEIQVDGLGEKTLKELNTLSAKSRLQRYEKLLADIYMENMAMAKKIDDKMAIEFREVIKTNFIRTAYGVQKAMGVNFAIDNLSDRAIALIVKHKWAKRTFSESIWGHIDTLNEDVREVLAKGFISGKSVDKMVKELERRTGVARSYVHRLVQNQCQYFANEGERQGYMANGIKKYVFMGANETRYACECSSLNNVTINIENAIPLKNFPPLHPNCICTTRAYFENSILNDNVGVRDYDESLSLGQWRHKYVKKNEEDLLKGLKEVLDCDIIRVDNPVDLITPELANKASYHINDRGHITLSLYDDEGKVKKQLHNTNHDNPKEHDMGLLGEHVHDWDYEAWEKELIDYKRKPKKNSNGKKIRKPRPARDQRPCTKEEQKIMERLL